MRYRVSKQGCACTCACPQDGLRTSEAHKMCSVYCTWRVRGDLAISRFIIGVAGGTIWLLGVSILSNSDSPSRSLIKGL